MELYSDYLLTNGKRPVNVYAFMKGNQQAEEAFYSHFSGFDALENEYLKHFFQKSLELLASMQGFDTMVAKEKLLNFYYIFFENLALNRSLVLTLLQQPKTGPVSTRLLGIKPLHKHFTRSINFEQLPLPPKTPGMVMQFGERFQEEILWLHFISIVDFWCHDQSAGFERTDVYIEKSIDTGFEVAYNSPLKKIFDMGKFLWEERFQPTV